MARRIAVRPSTPPSHDPRPLVSRSGLGICHESAPHSLEILGSRPSLGARSAEHSDQSVSGHLSSGREELSTSVLQYLYWSHFLARWGDRMWEFAVGLLLMSIWNDSLLLTAVYGLSETTSVAAFGVLVGNWIDRRPRVKAVKVSLVLHNSSIILASSVIVILLAYPGSVPGGASVCFTLILLINVCGAVSALSSLALNILVERDLVVVISEEHAPGLLPQLNSVMKRIDLSCKLLAPAFVGFLMSGAKSALICPLVISAWNLLSMGAEYYLLHTVLMSIPARQERVAATSPKDLASSREILPIFFEVPVEINQVTDGNLVAKTSNHDSGGFNDLVEGWRIYWQLEVMVPGVALALLYFTVLNFGSLMTAVLSWRGIPPFVLGLAKGLAAILGILATVVYPRLQARIGTTRTGLWAISLQWSFLSICAICVLVRSGLGASELLISGVVASRFGLWMFDLSVTQLMQDSVPGQRRGVVGGVQNSLQSALDMLSYFMGVIVSDPNVFGIPVFISYCSVGIALVLYARYCFRVQGSILHLEKLLHR